MQHAHHYISQVMLRWKMCILMFKGLIPFTGGVPLTPCSSILPSFSQRHPHSLYISITFSASSYAVRIPTPLSPVSSLLSFATSEHITTSLSFILYLLHARYIHSSHQHLHNFFASTMHYSLSHLLSPPLLLHWMCLCVWRFFAVSAHLRVPGNEDHFIIASHLCVCSIPFFCPKCPS